MSHHYKADPSGVRAMCAYLILRDKVIKPLLAGVVCPLGPAPKNQAPVDQDYVRLREELDRTLKPLDSRPLEKLAGGRQHVVVRCSISAYETPDPNPGGEDT
jgi:hypothetical protein